MIKIEMNVGNNWAIMQHFMKMLLWINKGSVNMLSRELRDILLNVVNQLSKSKDNLKYTNKAKIIQSMPCESCLRTFLSRASKNRWHIFKSSNAVLKVEKNIWSFDLPLLRRASQPKQTWSQDSSKSGRKDIEAGTLNIDKQTWLQTWIRANIHNAYPPSSHRKTALLKTS